DVIDFVTDEPNTKIKVDLTGKKGADGANGKDGSHGKRCVEDGLDGVPGENGQVGGNENIEKLITSGGEGGKGGNEGHGGYDHDGKKGDPGPKDHGLGFFLGSNLKEGEPGGDSGNGGDAGLGGFGGHVGEVHIKENRKIIHDNSQLVDKIESIDKSNRSAEHGKSGERGKGGVGGYDGVDTLYYKRAPIETCEGYILTVFHKAHWFSFEVIGVIDHDKPKKRDGISRAQGKTADMQIDLGKSRQKCENKEKSDEEQIKNQLNQAINNHAEKTNHISNNITNSINLLKDQRNEMLDERQTRVKTHQLSNSLLENAYRIAQQSLALHTTTMKSETENHILKTADTKIRRDKKNSSIRSQLTVDTDENECLQFQRHNSIIEKLTEDYELKKEHLMEKFKTKIKEIDHQIRPLRHKGKTILFKIDIDNTTR
ncbi:unnamed protein product, partial [Didymodactylos carnosus]